MDFRPASTMRKPPAGMMARRKGLSVWSPTMTSFSRSMYPGGCEVRDDGVVSSASSTPTLISSLRKGWRDSQTARVLVEGGERNSGPPV